MIKPLELMLFSNELVGGTKIDAGGLVSASKPNEAHTHRRFRKGKQGSSFPSVNVLRVATYSEWRAYFAAGSVSGPRARLRGLALVTTAAARGAPSVRASLQERKSCRPTP